MPEYEKKEINQVFIDKKQYKAVNVYSSTIKYVPNQYKTQNMCDKVVSK